MLRKVEHKTKKVKKKVTSIVAHVHKKLLKRYNLLWGMNYFHYLYTQTTNLKDMQDVNRLKIVLVEQKKTSKWLSEQLGVNPSTVSKWCTRIAIVRESVDSGSIQKAPETMQKNMQKDAKAIQKAQRNFLENVLV